MDKMKKTVWMSVVVIIGIIGLSLTYNEWRLNPFDSIALENISNTAIAQDLSLSFISDSSRTITVVTTDNRVKYVLHGGNRKEASFYFASELSTDDQGQLYVLNNQWDDSGSYINIENIKVFDSNGKYVNTLYEYEDITESHLRPVLKGLKWLDGDVRWFELDTNSVTAYYDGTSVEIAFDDAEALVQDVEWTDAKTFYLTTRRGRLFRYDIDSAQLTLVQDISDNVGSSYLNLVADESGNLFVNDIGKFGIFDIDGNSVCISTDFQEGPAWVYYGFDLREGRVVAVNDDQIIQRDASGNYSELGPFLPSQITILYRFIAWVSLLLIALASLYFLRMLTLFILERGLPKGLARTLTLVVAIIVSTGLISSLTINFYNDILVDQAANALKNIVQNSQFIIDGDLIQDIKGPSDFYGEAYQEVFDDLEKLIYYNEDPWNENLYTALYTIKDDRYFGLMYNDNGIIPYYPFNAFTDDPYYYYFFDAYEGSITEGDIADSDGEWLFSMGPVYNSHGDIVAIVEVGMNKYIFDEWHDNIMKNIITDILSLVIIAILLVSELNFFAVWNSNRKVKSDAIHQETNHLNVIRTLALLTYIMIFMCTAFVPIMSKSMYEPIGNLPMAIAISLPILSEVTFTALTIVIAGFIAERRGWRILFYLGVSLLMISAIATALTHSLILFILIRALAGVGNGMIQMTMHGFINTGKSIAVRNEVYANMVSGAVAGTNLGVVLGANLSDKLGYHNVFFVVFGMGILAIFFQFTYMKHYEVMASPSVLDEDETDEVATLPAGEMTALRFITRKNILLFFMFIMIPAFLCYMYLEYFFPLFAERNGLSTSVVGIVFSLYGLFIVYFGPMMSTVTEKALGVKKATTLASILTGLSLLIFAITGSVSGAIFAVFILAVSDSFGESVYTTYFLALKESQQLGKSIAAGYLEFSSQLGKMLGTLAFGIALGFGEKLGIGIIGLVTLTFGFCFMLFATRHGDEKTSRLKA